ncbi:MAG: YfhO family protein, partial [Lachnospiraceae bacterium]|nr:YfhO family protein [Lachnospiraceae bacterium]
ERMPYVIGFLFVLKYAVATVCAYAYIRRFLPPASGNTGFARALPALCGALLYAFSGFQSINIYYGFFHDVVAFFPLLLLGYEKLVHENRRGFFALAVMLNALVNYYFFIQEVLFLVLYHFCREGFHPVKNRRVIARCFLEGVTGVLQAGILFVPALISTMQNPRTDSFINPLRYLLNASRMYLFEIRSLLFPGELLDQPSCLTDYNYGSYSAYLPLVGSALVIAYLFKHKTDWLSRLLYICLLCMFVPALNAVFNLMIESSATVQRWLYMMILMMALASSRVIAEPEAYPVRRVSLFYAGFILLLTAFMYIWHATRYEMIRDGRMFLLYTAAGLAGVLVTALLFRIRHAARMFRPLMLFCVSLFCVYTTLLCTLRYQVPAAEASRYTAQADLYRSLRVDDARYRFFSTDNLLSMGGGQTVTGSFLSTKNSSILAFYRNFMDEEIGQSSIRMNYSNDELKGIRALLAGRYEISEAGLLTEDADTLPVGSVYDTYITASEFAEIPAELRAMAMLQWIILADDEAAAADGFLKHEAD